MKILKNEIEKLMLDEYNRAAEKFGKTNNSDHESFAVILEEQEEAIEQCNNFVKQLRCFWDNVKIDENDEAHAGLPDMLNSAINAACEWVQVAAMCHKAMVKKDT